MNVIERWSKEMDTQRKNTPQNKKENLIIGDNNTPKKTSNTNKIEKKMNHNKIKLGIVVAEFNYDVTYAMLELAKEHAEFLDANVEEILKVPGVFDVPLGVKKLIQRDIDAVVALGAVVEGQTEHDELIAQHASRKIMDLGLEHGKPVGLGISGPGMSRLEAHERVTYAKRAVEAAVKLAKKLRGGHGSSNPGNYGSSGDASETEEKAFDGLRAMG